MTVVPARFDWELADPTQNGFTAQMRNLPASAFEGHYPATPVLAGSLLVEAIRQAVEQWRAGPVRLLELLSARYYALLLPGERVSLDLLKRPEAGMIIHASVRTPRGPAAAIQLSLAPAAAPAPCAAPPCDPPEPLHTAALLELPAIRHLLPHRHPMLLIDRALVAASHDRKLLVASKAVSCNEPCFASMPEGGADWQYPEVLVMESFCQACGLLRASVGKADGDERVPVLARLVRFQFLRPVLPGCVLQHHVHIEASTDDGAVFGGSTWAEGECVAAVDRIVAALAPKP